MFLVKNFILTAYYFMEEKLIKFYFMDQFSQYKTIFI